MITVSKAQIQVTLAHLQEAGRRGSECVVLWLGRRQGDIIEVQQSWLPGQRAGMDYFEIPPHSMEQLFLELRKSRLMIAAQVHSHPKKAFHSIADDHWAIVRHEGALSLVLPHFGLKTDLISFNRDVAIFQLTISNQWVKIPSKIIHRFVTIANE